MASTGHQKGLWAENLAAVFLFLKGYLILSRRFRTPLGEIDLVARRWKTLVFTEVKLRKSTDAAAESIHAENRARVRRAAELYLQKHPRYNDFSVRFDALILSPRGWPRHIPNAF